MPHDHPTHGHPHPHPPLGHNRQIRQVASWELPRTSDAPSPDIGGPVTVADPDFDLVEASFIEAARDHSDPTSFLRLVGVPFRAKLPDERDCYLLGYLIEDVVEVGAISPGFGGSPATYNVVPARRTRSRRHLRFQYWTVQGEVRLSLAEARGLIA